MINRQSVPKDGSPL